MGADLHAAVQPGACSAADRRELTAALSSQKGCTLTEWPLRDARNRFSALVNAALGGETQLVTRRGRPVVVVLAVDEYERLRQLEEADTPTLGGLLLEIPQDDHDFERMFIPARPFSE